MKLLLTSSGITNTSLEQALGKLLGKPYNEATLTFIPTAANGEKGDKTWLVNDMNNFRVLGFSSFEITDISAVPKEIWLPSLERADILVFGGGNVAYLLEWMEKTGLKILLPNLLKTKVYVGISAGSMVTAKIISLTSFGLLYYEDTGAFENKPGLGLVDFEVWPHLNSPWFPKVRLDFLEQLAPKALSPFYAIDDASAVCVIDDDVSVISEGTWKKCK